MAEELDFSKAIEQVKTMLSSEEGEAQIQGILDMLSGGQNEAGEAPLEESREAPSKALPNSATDILSGLGDMENLMKIKSIMGAVGNKKNDSNVAFLQALKPFLSENRQSKLEGAAKILNVTRAIKALKDAGLGGV